MNSKVFKQLEFDKILFQVKRFADSAYGEKLLENLLPAENFDNALKLQNETEEGYKILFHDIVSPNFAIEDIDRLIENARKSISLNMGELLKISQNLRMSARIKNILTECNLNYLKDYVFAIALEDDIAEEIERSIVSENEMSDNASRELFEIRREIRKLGDKIKEKLRSYLVNPEYQKYLQDLIITVRDGRYVIPVKSEYKNMISGVVHDQSQSGATTFIETAEILQLNNELKTLQIKEKAEIERILFNLTAKVASEYENIKTNIENISYLDCVFAKARYAESCGAIKPNINNDGIVKIVKGRHPLIDKNKVVPVSLNFGRNFSVLLISGPNTGGKTVSLKMTGLFCLLCYCGLFLPCMEADISYFEKIFCDIGDEQNIELSLSTFSSHLKNIIEICDLATDKTLVLLDELGAGTDPSEGACLAVAVTEYLLGKGVKGIITSHFNEMKEFSMTDSKMENASMDFNPDTFEPTYILNMGSSGASNALHVARRLGLNDVIVNRARSLIAPQKIRLEEILVAAESSKRKANENEKLTEEMLNKQKSVLEDMEKEKAEVEKLRERYNEKLSVKSNELLEDYISRAESIIEEMKKLQKSSEVTDIFKAREFKNKIVAMKVPYSERVEVETVEDSFNVGDEVLIKDINTVAVVKGINRNKVRVLVGNIESEVKMDNLKKVKVQKLEKAKKGKVSVVKEISLRQPGREINVIGQNLDEAIYNVDLFIDQALVAGYEQVSIIHGIGKGVLREGLHKHFKTHPNVDEFRLGKFGEGERGVTILTLK